MYAPLPPPLPPLVRSHASRCESCRRRIKRCRHSYRDDRSVASVAYGVCAAELKRYQALGKLRNQRGLLLNIIQNLRHFVRLRASACPLRTGLYELGCSTLTSSRPPRRHHQLESLPVILPWQILKASRLRAGPPEPQAWQKSFDPPRAASSGCSTVAVSEACLERVDNYSQLLEDIIAATPLAAWTRSSDRKVTSHI